METLASIVGRTGAIGGGSDVTNIDRRRPRARMRRERLETNGFEFILKRESEKQRAVRFLRRL